jgi:hypothetical protein
MEQLQLLLNAMPVKIKTKQLVLDDWKLAGKGSNNWIRKLIPDDDFSFIGLMVNWTNEISFNSFHWTPVFIGKDLFYLNEIYNNYYPNIKPQFRDFQIKEAKQHLDEFIGRVNSLGSFL